MSTWKHFERLPRLPRGVLPVADALCRFNPIYGQGMSAAGQQVRLLQDVLGPAAAEPDVIAASQAGFMAETASVLQTPWTMSTSADLAFPGTRGERPEKFEEAQQFEAAPFSRRCRRSDCPSRHDGCRPAAAASRSVARTGHAATDRGGFRQGSRLNSLATCTACCLHSEVSGVGRTDLPSPPSSRRLWRAA